jgi:signal transduction histidine kinase
MPLRSRRDIRPLIEAVLTHLGGPERSRAAARLEGPRDALGPQALSEALREANLGEVEARRIGLEAASAADLALAARVAGVGSTERALRQADRLLPREHPDGVFQVRSLQQGEAHVVYTAGGPVDPLLCAMRAGLLAGLPRSFGAPPARVVELACAGRGGDACTFRVRWRRSIADRPLLQMLAVGAVAGAVLGAGGQALALWSPAATVTLFAALGIAAAAWLVESRRAERLGRQEGLVAELEQRIAERMDDLARIDTSLERRDATEPGGRAAASRRAAEEQAKALQRAIATFGRELAVLRGRAGAPFEPPESKAGALAQELDEALGRFERLRHLADALGGAQQGAARREREDLSALLAYVVQRARRREASGPEIVIDVPADLPFVHCDAVGIERALDQMLTSACESAGPAGRVEVRAAAVEGGVELSVCDDGAGADPERVEEALDPFFGQGVSAAGPGEGLRQAAEIVAAHGGALQLRAEADKGTRASFVLSRAPVR